MTYVFIPYKLIKRNFHYCQIVTHKICDDGVGLQNAKLISIAQSNFTF